VAAVDHHCDICKQILQGINLALNFKLGLSLARQHELDHMTVSEFELSKKLLCCQVDSHAHQLEAWRESD